MINEQGVRVRIPASTANLGPGFDTLGMALSLYAWVEMKPSETTSFHLHGNEMKGIPMDKSNLVFQVAQQVFAEAGVHLPELEISMYSDIPLTRGLGSSASAIIGALYSANALVGYPLSSGKLMDMATSLEKHPDNVGASLFGGIVVASWDGSHVEYIKMDAPENLEVLVAIPDFQLSTEKARQALPQTVTMQDAIYNISRASLLAAALSAGRLDLMAEAMRDRLHQPYRAALVPGLQRILDGAVTHGALGAALSGAGPTLLAFIDGNSNRKEELELFLRSVLAEEGISSTQLWLKPCQEGARVLDAAEQLPF